MSPTSNLPASQAFTPRTKIPRPELPMAYFNDRLKEESAHQPVKFQIIVREGQEIVVGRIKVPTPNGHAFILRRFDTGAISLSTMFRACFPTAPDEAEKAETNWVKTNFDTAGSNGGGRLRLAGSWVPPSLALYLATSYSLTDILPALANAVPEAKASYRKSTRPGNANGPSASGFTSNASQTVVNGNTASTHGIPTSLPPTTPKSVKSPMSKSSTKAGSPSRPPPAKRSRKSASPAPSTLLKSTPGKVNFTSPHRQADVPEEEEPEVPGPDPDQDIAEAKAEVARLKAEHSIVGPATPAASKKRAIEATETPPPKFDMERIEQSAMDLVQDRPIINRRRLSNLPPTRKAAAWGSLAFLLGLGFSAALPTLLPGGGFW